MAEPTPGIVQGALELLAAAWSYLRARGELASIEGREAGAHWLKALALLLGGLLVLWFGWLFLCLALVFAVATALGGGAAWIWVTMAMAVVHFAGAALLLARVRSLAGRPLFPATLDEFKKDQAWLDAKTGKQS